MNWLAMLGLDRWTARWRSHIIEGAIAAEDRLDLARLEWAEQKSRLVQLLVLAIVAIGLTVVTLMIVSLAVLVQFWDSPHRSAVGWTLAVVWLVLWAGSIGALVSISRRAGNGFALTRRELAQDWNALKEKL